MSTPQDPRPVASPRIWPATPADLVDTTLCPSCFRRLSGQVCGFCGLDLRSPMSAKLLELGRTMVTTEAERQAMIARLRAERAPEAPAAIPETIVAPTVVTPTVVPGQTVAHHATDVSAGIASTPHPDPIPSGGGVVHPPVGLPIGVRAAGPVSDPAVREAPFAADTTTSSDARPRRSSAQILLLTAGVISVSVCAIFFAVLAYVVASVETRSILTASASLVVLGIAWFLRRRGLDGTAEGIAVIGVVLLLLDIWIVRVNRLFAVDRLDASLYTGLALLIVTAILAGVSRVTSLRAPSVSAAVIGPAGVFALVFGASRPTASETSGLLLGAVATTLVVLLELVPAVPHIERVTLRVVSIVAGVFALVAAFFAFPSIEAGPAVAFGLTGIAWLVLLMTIHRRSRTDPSSHGRAWPFLASVGLAFAASGFASGATDALAGTALQADEFRPAALAVMVGVILVGARAASAPLARPLEVGAAVVAGIVAVLVLPALEAILTPVGRVSTGRPFRLAPLDAIDTAAAGVGDPGAGSFVVGAALTSVVLVGALTLVRSARVVSALSWAPVALATLAAVGAAILAPSVLATVVIAAVTSTALLGATVWRRLPGVARVTAFVGALLSAVAVAGFAYASAGVWALATLVVLAILVGARVIALGARRPLSSAGATLSSGLGVIVFLLAGGMASTWVSHVVRVPDQTPAGWGAAVASVAILGTLSLGDRRRVPLSELSVLAGIALLVLVPSAVSVWLTGSVDADAGWRLVLTGLAVVSTGSWMVVRRADRVRAGGAAAGVPLVTLLVADASIVVSAGSGAVPGTLASAVLLAALSALLVVAGREGRLSRSAAPIATAAELAIGATSAVTLVLAVAEGGPLARLALLVIALVPTLIAFRAHERNTSRRHIAWAGAVLAVAGLWWFLVDENVTVVEYYTLPVAGLLLAIAGISGSRAPAGARTTDSVAPTGLDVIVAAALAVGILPSALIAAEGWPTRALLTAGAGIVLIVLALVVLSDTARVRARSVAWTGGVIAVALPVVVRVSLGPSTTGDAGPADDIVSFTTWVGGTTLVLIAAALAVARVRRAPVLSDIATTAVAVALGITVPAVLLRGGIGGVDASPWLAIVCGLAVVGFALGGAASRPGTTRPETARPETTRPETARPETAPPETAPPATASQASARPAAAETAVPSSRRATSRARPSARVLAIVGAVSALGIAITSLGSVENVEWVTVPLAVAALTAGAIRLVREPAVGSWPALSPGLLVLLLPSLAYDLGESALWRVVALGAVAVASTILGARARLQSPLIIGAVVTVFHALAQLWPWISGLYEAGYWWIWAGIGGVLLIAFAARYEQRMQNLRHVGRALRSLR